MPLRRQEQGDVLAEDLLGPVSEEALGASVPAGDFSIQAVTNYGVIG
jgi:hypothetical protein